MTTGVVVTHAYRTAVGKSGKGALAQTRPDELLGLLIKGFLEQTPDLDPAAIDDVIIGCAFPEGEQGMNVARLAALRAGLPIEVPGMTLSLCTSNSLKVTLVRSALTASPAPRGRTRPSIRGPFCQRAPFSPLYDPASRPTSQVNP